MRTHRFTRLLAASGLVAALFVGSACVEDTVNKALKNSGISTDGSLPKGFPSTVPVPGLPLETGIGSGDGTFTLRYTSSHAKIDSTSYKTLLTQHGYTISGGYDSLGDTGKAGYVSFTAQNAHYEVLVSTYADPSYAGGNYMALIVSPVTAS